MQGSVHLAFQYTRPIDVVTVSLRLVGEHIIHVAERVCHTQIRWTNNISITPLPCGPVSTDRTVIELRHPAKRKWGSTLQA